MTLFSQVEKKYSTNENTPEWVELMYTDNSDPGDVIRMYDLYFSSHEIEKNQHTQYYKRWLRRFSRDINYTLNSELTKKYIEASKQLNLIKTPTSAWNCIGPYDFDIDAASRSYAPGAAHVYTVERSLSNAAIMYAGTATAGLWKSTDAGVTWGLVTRDLLVNGIVSIEINHLNEDVVYFESGGDLYKTIDGGLSWNIIGDVAFQSNDHNVKDIVMSPVDTNELYLSSNFGFYRSTDAGQIWNEVLSGEFQEIELNPSDPTMLYLIKVVDFKTEFYKSADSGISFTQITNGWPNPTGSGDNQERVEIAVTPANSNLIYANATGVANGGSGTYGIYLSTDQGENWTFQCCGGQPAGIPSPANINMMGWDQAGQDDGGQYYYDVAFAVDPVNENKLHLGGVNHWVSTDAGITWDCPSKWSTPELPAYVHADIHDIRFLDGELWIACDGGVFKSTDGGTNFNKSMVGIEGTDFWGFGASPQSDVMLGGAYHNGTLLKDNSTYINDWICTGGGDGVRGYVNFGNDRVAYDDYEGRNLSGDRTVNIGSFQFDSLPNASYIIGESSDMAFDPRNYNHIYFGRGKNLLKTEDNGNSYSIIYTFEHRVMAVEIAQSNLDVMYVTTYEDWWGAKNVWRSENGGASWLNITPPASLLSGDTWVPYDITVSATNEYEIWLARTSQYSSSPNLNNKQIFKSTSGGSAWNNYTTATLDGEWVTNIIHQAGTDGGVYIGTRRAVYYRNNSMADWALFNTNLPLSTFSTKLVIKYKDKLLRNATNRSVYEVEMYEFSQPIAQISADKFMVNCMDNIVHFVDNSVLSSDNASWSWSFPGGTPSTSTNQNPIVTYSAIGEYDVSLTVTDDYGTDSQSYTAFISYQNNVTNLDFQDNFENGLTSFWAQSNANNSFGWGETYLDMGPECVSTKATWVNHYYINAVGDEAGLGTEKINLSGASNIELTYDYAYAKYPGYSDGLRIDISTDCWDSYDVLFLGIGDDLETVDDQGAFWVPVNCSDWSVGNSIDLNSYSGQEVMIRFTAINGYGNSFFLDNVNILGDVLDLEDIENASIQIYPNPSNGQFVIEHNLDNPSVTVTGLNGRVVYSTEIKKSKQSINIDGAPGVYNIELKEGDRVFNKKMVIN